MAERGGQPGNTNASKNRPITDMLRRALLANDGERMRELTEAVIARAILQSDSAAKEILERIEGKVPQAIVGPGDAGEHTVITRIEEVIVDPNR